MLGTELLADMNARHMKWDRERNTCVVGHQRCASPSLVQKELPAMTHKDQVAVKA
jgi:hypothetical protein